MQGSVGNRAPDGSGSAEYRWARLWSNHSSCRAVSARSDEVSRGIGGLGIGLFLSKELAERDGGWIEVASELQKGSTVTLRLPLEAA